MVATGKQGGHVTFDMASGPFKWPGSALMWPCSTLKNPLGLKKNTKKMELVDKAY